MTPALIQSIRSALGPEYRMKSDRQIEHLVRAVLGVVREPSERMTYSGSWAVGPGGDRAKQAELAKAFRAMIDAILAEGA